MATKTYSDVSGKEIPIREQVSVSFQIEPLVKGEQSRFATDLTFDVSLKEAKQIEKAMLAMFPKADQ